VFSSPAVAGDLVFVGSCNGLVHAIDRRTGQALWKYNALQDGGKRAEFHGNPVLTDELLVLASDDRNPQGVGYVYAFEKGTGRVRWKYRAGAGVMADLVRDGNRLYAVTLEDELISLDLRSGRPHWRFASGWVNEQMTNVSSTAAVIDGRVVFAGQNGLVHALDPESGRLIWKRDVGARVMTPLLGVPGGIYFGTVDRRIHFLGLGRDPVHAELGVGGVPSGPPVLFGDSLLLLVYSNEDEAVLKSVDRSLKAVRWTREAPGGWTSARTCLWRGNAVVGSNQGKVAAFAANGSEVWADTVGGVVRGIGLADDVLYVGTLKGTVSAYRPVKALMERPDPGTS
jgi:outer membrane protein assembly factor BamB